MHILYIEKFEILSARPTYLQGVTYVISDPPSSFGGFQVSVQLSAVRSVTFSGPSGGPGLSAVTIKKFNGTNKKIGELHQMALCREEWHGSK